MITVTIFINGTPVETVKAINEGPVSLEDLPTGADPDEPICWYHLLGQDNEEVGRFMHNRNEGATKCAFRMLWNRMQDKRLKEPEQEAL